MPEHTYTSEESAHRARRSMIDQGGTVSLVAYDPAREVYAFDCSVLHGRPNHTGDPSNCAGCHADEVGPF